MYNITLDYATIFLERSAKTLIELLYNGFRIETFNMNGLPIHLYVQGKSKHWKHKEMMKDSR